MIFQTSLKRMAERKATARAALSAAAILMLSACSSLGASGPSSGSIGKIAPGDARVRVVALDEPVARQVASAERQESFASRLGNVQPRHDLIGAGDVLDVAIWEAPPAVLFPAVASANTPFGSANGTSLPPQMVDADGTVVIPFGGRIKAVGRSPNEVAREIQARLGGKAHDPQVMVRIARNQGATVTVVGDVAASRRMPLTTRNERLLDALAEAGGVRQPVDKVLIQVTRGSIVATRPLGAIIRDPAENVPLAADDIVTALFQPYSFQALGALGANAEVPFEGTGITLAQAVARVGGLQDNRANVRGVFIFRFENPAALPERLRPGAPLTAEGKVPVIYRLDMSDPATFFVMQTFPMRDKDILYVSNAPAVDFQKFANLISQMTFSISSMISAVP